MPTVRQLQFTLLIALAVVAILAIFMAGNYGMLMFFFIIAINAGLSMYMQQPQWDAIVAGLCLYSGLMLVDPVGLSIFGRTPWFAGFAMKNIANILAMIGFFFCSYLGWMIFRQKQEPSIYQNAGGFMGFNPSNIGGENNFVPFAGRATAIN